MSCDRLAAHAISALAPALPAPTREQLQAVYDQPGQLQSGEDRPALVRAAKALVLRLKAIRADIPEHLNLDSPRSKAAIKFGRLALALSAADHPPASTGEAPQWAAMSAPVSQGDAKLVAQMRRLAVSMARIAFHERLAAGERVPAEEALAYLQQQRERQPAAASSVWSMLADTGESGELGERDAFAAAWDAELGGTPPVQEGEGGHPPPPPPITATPDTRTAAERLTLDLAVPGGPPGAAHAALAYHGRRGYRYGALRQHGIREAVVVEGLLVYDQFQRRGYGERLLQAAIAHAHAEGLPLVLKAAPSFSGPYSRPELIAWYQQRGGALLTEGGQWLVWPVPHAGGDAEG